MKPDIYTILSGLPVVIIGELLRIWAVSYAGSETRTTEGVGGSNLITQGPFALLRNPLYLGNIMIYSGIGIMSYAFFPYLQLFALCFFTFQYFCIILTEEEYLEISFGEKFIMYKKSVNRFIPKRKKLPDYVISKSDFDLKSGLKSEYRSLQSIFISISIILFYYLFFVV